MFFDDDLTGDRQPQSCLSGDKLGSKELYSLSLI